MVHFQFPKQLLWIAKCSTTVNFEPRFDEVICCHFYNANKCKIEKNRITQDYRYKLTAGHYLLQTANKWINGIQLKDYAEAGQSCLFSFYINFSFIQIYTASELCCLFDNNLELVIKYAWHSNNGRPRFRLTSFTAIRQWQPFLPASSPFVTRETVAMATEGLAHAHFLEVRRMILGHRRFLAFHK